MEEIKPNILKKVERDENGLIKGIEYKFTQDGLIDYRSMVPIQYLYINNDPKHRERIEKQYGKPYSEIDIIKDNVKDTDLIILLGGIKYLAKLRGFKSVKYNIKEANPEYVAVNCELELIPNYESENISLLFQDNACAHLGNTSNFATKYLLEIATNRAFCRAVRNCLNINIVSREELGASTGEAEQQVSRPAIVPQRQVKLLCDIMKAKGVLFKHLEDKMKAENTFKPEYKTIEDLPKDLVFSFIERLKKMPSV
jgi:hypothetical protein